MQVKNNKSGFEKLHKTCSLDNHFVMENIGIYHAGLMFYLHDHDLVYSVVNTFLIKRYIQMHLECNKSDTKYARRICEYGVERKPEPTKMPDKEFFKCQSLNNAIHDISKDITKFSNPYSQHQKGSLQYHRDIGCLKKPACQAIERKTKVRKVASQSP